MSPEQFVEACRPFTSVSHETFVNLKSYVALLTKWQDKINLVSRTTLDDIWQRHIFDSAQLLQYIKASDRVIDFGSGAGFPALVLAIMGVQQVTVIESDQRKVAFMREVARATQTQVTFINARIETVEPIPADVLTARALSSVGSLLDLFLPESKRPWLSASTKAVLLKGTNVKDELTLAAEKWHIDFQLHKSLADATGAVLIIEKAEAKTND